MLAQRQPELQHSRLKGEKKSVNCSKGGEEGGKGGVDGCTVVIKGFEPQLLSVNPVELMTKQDTRWCKSIRA